MNELPLNVRQGRQFRSSRSDQRINHWSKQGTCDTQQERTDIIPEVKIQLKKQEIHSLTMKGKRLQSLKEMQSKATPEILIIYGYKAIH